MFRNFSNIRIVGASLGISARKETIVNRDKHVFFYKAEGESIYTFSDQQLHFTTDTVLFLPQGSTFSYEKTGQTDGRYLSASFYADHDGLLEPVLITPKSPSEVRKLFVKLRRAYRFGGEIGKIEAYSYFYKLLAIFERELQQKEASSCEDRRIEPAVAYLQEHLFDPALRITKLHTLCKLSAPSFRKLFEAQFSTTPKKYVLQQRMQEARDILKNGEYENIGQLAAQVGFEDQLYFSKCFKSFYGVSPSSYTLL